MPLCEKITEGFFYICFSVDFFGNNSYICGRADCETEAVQYSAVLQLALLFIKEKK